MKDQSKAEIESFPGVYNHDLPTLTTRDISRSWFSRILEGKLASRRQVGNISPRSLFSSGNYPVNFVAFKGASDFMLCFRHFEKLLNRNRILGMFSTEFL